MDSLFLGNTWSVYSWFGAWIIGAFIFKKLIANTFIAIITRLFKKQLYEVSAKELKEILSKSLQFFILIVAIYIAVQPLHFPKDWSYWVHAENFDVQKALWFIYRLIFGISLTWVFLKIIECIGLIFSKKYEKRGKTSILQVIPFGVDFTKIIVAIIAGLVIISQLFHINVATFVAGLGIGGVAIALAAKETLENLLGSFIIFLDKPFLVGDFIYINNTYCTVDKVGLRSTRFRTINRTYLTLPNRVVIGHGIENYSLRDMRRADRTIQLSRKTTFSQITKIIEETKAFLKQNNRTSTEDNMYVNFHQISDVSLDIRLQYYVTIDDWAVYLEVVEEVNLKLLEIIENNKAELAYPTRTIQINQQ